MAGLQLPALAGGMHQGGVWSSPRRAWSPVMGEVWLEAYRPAGDMQPPPLPLLREIEVARQADSRRSPAERALPVLLLDSRCRVYLSSGGLIFFPPSGPVSGQGGVIGGCARPLARHVPLGMGRPGELDQVGAAVAVAEHPAVVPELVELAEVPADDPALRFVLVAPCGRFRAASTCSCPASRTAWMHHAPVVGRPAPDDGVERGETPSRCRRAACASRTRAVPGVA